MASTVAELLVRIGADISGLKKGMSDADAGVKGLERSVDATASKLGKGFDTAALQVTGSLGRIPVVGNAAFQEIVTAAQSAFSRVDAASQVSGQSIKSIADAANVVAPALNNVAASAQTIGSSVSGQAQVAAAGLKSIGVNATSASQAVNSASAQARDGLNSIGGGAATAGNSVATLTAQIAQNKALIAGYDTDIAAARGELALLNQRIIDATQTGKANSETVKALRAEYAQLSAATRGLSAEKAILGNENKSLSAQLQNTGKNTETTSGFMRVLSGLMTTQTTQITSQGTAWAGYDSSIQAVVRSFGGIPVIWALAIGVAGTLLTKVIDLGKATQKQVELNTDLIQSDVELLGLLRALASGNTAAAESFRVQATAQEQIVKADLTSILATLTINQDNAAKTAKNLSSAQTELREKLAFVNTEVDLSRRNAMQLLDAQEVLGARMGVFTEAVGTAAQAHGKNSAEVEKNLSALIEFAAQNNMSQQAVLAFAQSNRIAANTISLITDRLADGAIAAREFQSALSKVKMPEPDAFSTGEGLKKLADQISDSVTRQTDLLISKGVPAQKAYNEALLMHEPAVKKFIDSAEKKVAMDHAGALGAKNHATAQALLRNEIKQIAPSLSAATDKLVAYEKSHKAFSDSATRGAKSARASFDSLKESVVGIGPAFDFIQKQLEEKGDTLFDFLPKAATKSTRILHGQLNQSFKVVTDTINEYLQGQNIQAKATAATLEQVGAAGTLALMQQAKQQHDALESMNVEFIKQASTRKKLLDDFKSLLSTQIPAPQVFDTAKLIKDSEQFRAAIDKMKAQLAGGLDVSDSVISIANSTKSIISNWEEMAGRVGLSALTVRENVLAEIGLITKGAPELAKQAAQGVIAEWDKARLRAQQAMQEALSFVPKIKGIGGEGIINLPKPDAEALEQVTRSFERFLAVAEKVRVEGSKAFGLGAGIPELKSAVNEIINTMQGIAERGGQPIAKFETDVIEALTRLGIAGGARAKEAVDIILGRFREGIEREKKAITISLEQIPLGANIFDQAEFASAGERFLSTLKRFKESIKDSIGENEALLGLRQSAQGIISVLKDMGERLGLTREQILKNAEKLIQGLIPPGSDEKVRQAAKALIDNLRLEFSRMQISFDWELTEVRMQNGAASAVEGAIREFETMGARLGKTGNDLKVFVDQGIAPILAKVPPEFKKAAELAYQEWKNGLNKLPGALDDVFNKILSKWKGAASGILDIIGALPQSIAGKLQAGTNAFLTWVDRIDTILRGLHKIFNDIPDGLGEALKSVINIFKSSEKAIAASVGNSQQEIQKAAKAASGSVDTMAKDSEEGSQGIQKAFGVATAAVGAFVSGLSVAAATGSKAIGSIVGGIQGALSGFAAGGPIGAVIGGIGGILGGLFGGGKSAAQKEQERLQQEQLRLSVERAKQDVQKGAQEVVQAALSTFIKAREALEAISAHFRIPKTVFNAFFKDLNILLDQFVKLAGKFKDDIYGKAKLFAESMSPAVDLISKAPLALEAIGKYLGVTESAIVRFFADFGKIVDHLGILAEATPNKLEKHLKKFAARIGDAVGLVADVGAGLKALFEVKPLDAGAFDNFGLALEAIINKVGDIAERFDKYYIKQIGLFSERVAPAINLFAGTVQAIKDALEVPRLNPATLEGVFTDLTAIVNRAIDFTKAIPTDVLALVAETATRLIPVINVIQSMAEAFKAVVDYKSVKGAFQDLLADFTEAVSMMRHLEDLSFQMETRAISIEGALTRAAAAMTSGIAKFGSALSASHSVITGGLSSFTSVANPEGTGSSFSGLNFMGNSIAPGIGPYIPSGPSIVNNHDNRISINGMTLNDEQSANLRRVLEAIFGPLERLVVAN